MTEVSKSSVPRQSPTSWAPIGGSLSINLGTWRRCSVLEPHRDSPVQAWRFTTAQRTVSSTNLIFHQENFADELILSPDLLF